DIVAWLRRLLLGRPLAPLLARAIEIAQRQGWDQRAIEALAGALGDALDRPDFRTAVAELVDEVLAGYRERMGAYPRLLIGLAHAFGLINRDRLPGAPDPRRPNAAAPRRGDRHSPRAPARRYRAGRARGGGEDGADRERGGDKTHRGRRRGSPARPRLGPRERAVRGGGLDHHPSRWAAPSAHQRRGPAAGPGPVGQGAGDQPDRALPRSYRALHRAGRPRAGARGRGAPY